MKTLSQYFFLTIQHICLTMLNALSRHFDLLAEYIDSRTSRQALIMFIAICSWLCVGAIIFIWCILDICVPWIDFEPFIVGFLVVAVVFAFVSTFGWMLYPGDE